MRGSTHGVSRDLLVGLAVVSVLLNAVLGVGALRLLGEKNSLSQALRFQTEDEVRRALGPPTDVILAADLESVSGRYLARGYDLTEVRIACERFVLYQMPLSSEMLVLCCTRHGRILGRQLLAPR